MKAISILGATGSIGKNTLEIVKRFPDRFCVKAIAGATNIDLLAEQIQAFEPDIAVVLNERYAQTLKKTISDNNCTEILYGEEGYKAAATHPEISMVVSAIVGSAGLLPTVAAINAGKDIALANKETLVMAGDYVMSLAQEKMCAMLPVDSEHSAIFQCLHGHERSEVKHILLTASGGPFRTLEKNQFETITPEAALSHPTWEMGKKISIDSATLMNKGLEVIEASHLFDLSGNEIEVVVHPQSIVHSMVAFTDGAVLAHMGVPDMKGAISYAMSYPERLPLDLPVPDFAALKALTFETPDMETFRCLKLAYEALEAGGTLPTVLNAANEIAVQGFLDKAIGFNDIAKTIESVMNSHHTVTSPDIETIIEADQRARQTAYDLIIN